MNSAEWTAFAAIVTAAVTAVYAWLTFRLVGLTRRQANAMQTPHLTCTLRASGDQEDILLIANHSDWPAYTLRVDVVGHYWGDQQVERVLDSWVDPKRRSEAANLVAREDDLARLGVYDRFHTQVLPARHRLVAPSLCPGQPNYVEVLIFFRVASSALVLQSFAFSWERDHYQAVVTKRANPQFTLPFDFPADRTRLKYGLRGRVRRLRGKYVRPKSMATVKRALPRRIPRSLKGNYDLLELLDGHVVVPGWLRHWSGDMVEGRGVIEPM